MARGASQGAGGLHPGRGLPLGQGLVPQKGRRQRGFPSVCLSLSLRVSLRGWAGWRGLAGFRLSVSGRHTVLSMSAPQAKRQSPRPVGKGRVGRQEPGAGEASRAEGAAVGPGGAAALRP